MRSYTSVYKVFIKIIVPALAGTMLLYSCKTDIERVQELAEREKVPSVAAKNIEIVYTENGKIKVKISAPESLYYQFAEEPYNEFPLGIVVINYTDSLTIDSQLTANYAIYYEKKKLWNARYNVVAVNSKGHVLKTEQLFWDEAAKRIYSNDMVKITTAEDEIFGEGFESDENFDNWVVRKITATFYFDEE
jgi:LPS export ABC transporter protein LptC